MNGTTSGSVLRASTAKHGGSSQRWTSSRSDECKSRQTARGKTVTARAVARQAGGKSRPVNGDGKLLPKEEAHNQTTASNKLPKREPTTKGKFETRSCDGSSQTIKAEAHPCASCSSSMLRRWFVQKAPAIAIAGSRADELTSGD